RLEAHGGEPRSHEPLCGALVAARGMGLRGDAHEVAEEAQDLFATGLDRGGDASLDGLVERHHATPGWGRWGRDAAGRQEEWPPGRVGSEPVTGPGPPSRPRA